MANGLGPTQLFQIFESSVMHNKLHVDQLTSIINFKT